MNTQVDHNNLELLRALLQIPCPSGREERMAAFICRHITALGFQPELDAQGNVWTQLASRSDSEGPIALASHMDEIAMVVNAIEADGTLRVQRSGGLHPWKLGECPVQLVGDGDNLVPAHLSFGSGHTNDPDDPIAQFASFWARQTTHSSRPGYSTIAAAPSRFCAY